MSNASGSQEERQVAPGGFSPPVAALTLAGERVRRLAVEIMRKRREKLEQSSSLQPKPRRSIWASSIPDCERQGVYEFTHWKEKKMFDWKLLTLFQMGHVNEAEYKRELRDLGFDLVDDSAALSEDMFKNYGLSGYLDTKIKWEGVRIPIEMKLMSPFIFDKIDGINADDIEKVSPEYIERGIESMNRFPWTRKYLRQGQVYMLGTHEEALMFALTDGRGNWKFVIQQFDYDKAESILKIAQSIKAHKEAGTLPGRIPYDNENCGRCPFAHVCLPDIENDPSIKVINNIGLETLLLEWEKLKPKKARYDKIDKEIKATCKGVENAAVGDFIISQKIIMKIKYEWPDDLKKKYGKKKPEVRVIIERILRQDPETMYIEPGRSPSLAGDDDAG